MSDVRPQYRELTEEEKSAVAYGKHMGQEFLDLCDEQGQSREMSLAKTKMQEALFWFTHGVTK